MFMQISNNKNKYAPSLDIFVPATAPPERRLIAATLVRAIKDLTCSERSVARGAMAFIKVKRKKIKEWSFKWLCQELTLDPMYFINMPEDELLAISRSLHNL